LGSNRDVIMKKIYIGIKDGKIWDICGMLESKRTDFDLPEVNYLNLDMNDFVIGDTWDFEKNESLKDAPKRFEPKPKTQLELMQEEIDDLKVRLIIQEAK